ncbi:hypothetical protein ABG067_008639, partial [Albugo candida]
MNCIGAAKLPQNLNGMELEARLLGDLLWTFRTHLDHNNEQMKQLSSSHLRNQKILARKEPGYENIKSLTGHLVE